MLLAPHAASQIRMGVLKVRDLHTGEIVEKLCEETGCWGLIATRMQMDPNWYPESPFRVKLKELIREKEIDLVLDIHGKKDDGKTAIDFYPNKAFKEIGRLKFENTSIKHFKNDEQITIAEDLGELGLAGVQIEISRTGRTTGTEENKMVKKYLREIIADVN